MKKEDIYKITSDNYDDYIVDNIKLNEIIESYPDAAFIEVNNQYSIAYIPQKLVDNDLIYAISSYESIPICFGLMAGSYDTNLSMNQLEYRPENYLSGEGVLVGFVDTGIDYLNPSFQYENNTSRIFSIWDQTIMSENNYPEGFYYGREYNKDEINSAIKDSDPYGVVPSTDIIGHGTALAGITAGSPNKEVNFRGVAYNAEYVVVKLKEAKAYIKEFFYLPQDTVCYQENDLMLGIKYLFQISQKLNRPLVICLGVGTSQGEHLGVGIFNSFLKDIGRSGLISLVISAGNEGERRHHYYGEIKTHSGTDIVELNVGTCEFGFFMEFWGNAPNVFTVDIYSPTGRFVGHVPYLYIKNETVVFEDGPTVISVDYKIASSEKGDQSILFRFYHPQVGLWKFYVNSVGDLSSSFHIWLPIINFISKDTYFIRSNPETTIVVPGNIETMLTVTAYDETSKQLYTYASEGFTKDNRPKPDITAPGVNVLAPFTDNTFVYISGTSAAAAYAAGGVALILEWAIVKGNSLKLTSAEIRSMVTYGARRQTDMSYPNPEWGFGIMDIYNSIRLTLKGV